MRILLVEDEAISRRASLRLLMKEGYDVEMATDGRRAWELLQREDFSVVITDWLMPEIDGLELCRLIRGRSNKQYTYIILVTAKTGKTDYLEGLESGADDFLSKPYDPDVLRARLRVAKRLLDLRQQVERLQGLLPICQYCKKIRDDKNLWTQIEAYISEHSSADFTHGICPECEEIHVRPQLEELMREQARRNARL